MIKNIFLIKLKIIKGQRELMRNLNSEKPQKNSNSGLPRFMPTLLPNDESFEMIMSLNIKQHTVFDVVQERVRNYDEYKNVNVQSNHIFYMIVVGLENHI